LRDINYAVIFLLSEPLDKRIKADELLAWRAEKLKTNSNNDKAQASGKNLTRPPMPSAPRFALVTSSRPNKGVGT
jgi:hypothetical protein